MKSAGDALLPCAASPSQVLTVKPSLPAPVIAMDASLSASGAPNQVKSSKARPMLMSPYMSSLPKPRMFASKAV